MKRLFTAALMLLAAYSAYAIKIIHGPYLQSVSETEATIVWVTDTKALSWVEVAPNDGSNFYNVERPKYYESYLGKRPFKTVHTVRITGLEPGTTYRYGVASKEVLEQNKHRVHYGDVAATRVYGKGHPKTFTTLNPKKESIEFIVLNDIHSKQEKLSALLNLYSQGKTDIVVYNGDMVSMVPTEQVLFDGFVDYSVKTFAEDTPFFMVRGNHETRGFFAENFMTYFPTRTGKPYYTFTHGPAFFIVLDGGEDKPDSNLEYYETADYDNYRREEAKWLQTVVDSQECKNAKYRIVLTHMPYIGQMWHGPQHAGDCFLPILNKANITVMLSGHTHKYSYNTPENTKATFPILVNGHSTALKAKVNQEGIAIDVVDMNGTTTRSHSFK